jgi:hypothetical protein
MKPWRERVPYEWCVAVSAAGLLAISPWVSSIPFSRLLGVWSYRIGESLLGRSLVAPANGFVAMFLLIYAGVLSLPLLVFCSHILDAPQSIVRVVRTAVALMFLLAGMGTVDAIIDLGSWFVFGQIAVGCTIGILFLIFGVQLCTRHPLSLRIRLLSITLVIAGACMATFVLLPAGLLALCVTYILLVIILASRRPEGFEYTN